MNPTAHSANYYHGPYAYDYQRLLDHQHTSSQNKYPLLPSSQPVQQALYPHLNHQPIHSNSLKAQNNQNSSPQVHPNPNKSHNGLQNCHQTDYLAKLKKIENEIANAKYTCHVIWLYFLLGLSTLSLAIEFYYYVNGWNVVPFIICFLSSFWTFCSSILGIKALRKGSLEDAIKAVWFMKGYIVPLVGFIIHFLNEKVSFNNSSDNVHGNKWADGFLINIGLICSITGLFVHVFVFLAGARKFRNLLMKRNKLRQQSSIPITP